MTWKLEEENCKDMWRNNITEKGKLSAKVWDHSGSLRKFLKNILNWASLVAQWLTICLLMQGTRVRALVWEDPACRRATGPVSHDCWACASGACAPQQERPRWWRGLRTAMRSGPRLPQLGKAIAQKRRPNTAKNKYKNKLKNIYIFWTEQKLKCNI